MQAHNWIDLAGVVKGRWHVLTPAGKSANGKAMWLCRCACGTERVVASEHLVSGTSRSCGCLQKETTITRCKLQPFLALFNVLKRSAKRAGHPVAMSLEEFVNFTGISTCHYCDTGVVWIDAGYGPYNLDRKDTTLGYAKENCVVCCNACNRGKGNQFTYEEWVVMTSALKGLRNGNTKQHAATA
jgi:hypothetical protein